MKYLKGEIKIMRKTGKKITALAIVTILLISSFAVITSFIFNIDQISFKYEESVSQGDLKEKIELPATSGFTLNPEGGENPHQELFYIRDSSPTRYIKTVSCNRYDGELWKLGQQRNEYYYGSELEIDGVSNYEMEIENDIFIDPINEFPEGFIPVSTYTTSVEGVRRLKYYPEENVFYSHYGFFDSYSFDVKHYRYREDVLNNSDIIDKEEYIQLPDSISQKIYELANDITEGYDGGFQKALAIQEYLKENYEYNADYEKAPEGHEPTDWFLFEEREGVCANFNSALAVLGRAADLPTRMVKGYKVNDTNSWRKVYSDQAHSWVELGLECGWITFDATPNSDCDNCIYHEEESKIGTSIDLQVPDEAYPGEAISIQTELKNNVGRTLSDRNLTLNIDSIRLDENITEYNMTERSIPSFGGIVKSLPYTGRYRVKASFNGSENYQASSTTKTIKVNHYKFQILTDEVFIRNGSTDEPTERIKGYVFYEGEPIKDEDIRVNIVNSRNNETIKGPLITETDKDGYFEFDYSPAQHDPLGKARIEYVHINSGNIRNSTVNIKSIPNIKIDTSQTYDKIKIRGKLKDNQGDAIDNESVLIYINSTETGRIRDRFEKVSGQNGVIEQVIKHPSDDYFKESLEINVVLKGSSRYVEADEKIEVTLENKNKGPIKFIGDKLDEIVSQYWYIIILVIFGSVITLGLRNITDNKTIRRSHEFSQKTKKDKVKIMLKQINENLPYVWIVNERIGIEIDVEGSRRFDRLQVFVDGEKVKEKTNFKSNIDFYHVFEEKGIFEIEAKLYDDEEVTKKIDIEIVDHKKGIQVLYTDLLERLKDLGYDIKEEDTPATIENSLVDELGHHESIREVKRYMEKAKYSYQDLDEKDFKRMMTYLNSLGELLER